MQTPPSGARGPRCKAHGVPAVQRSVNSGKNAGRPAWMCSLALPNGCGFVAWADFGSNALPPFPSPGGAWQGAESGGGGARRQLNFGGRMTPGGSPGAAPQFGGGASGGGSKYNGGTGGGGTFNASPNSSPQQAPGRALPASLRSPAAGSQGGSQPQQGGPPGSCYHCGQPGHWANNCPHRGAGTPSQGGSRARPASLASPTRQGGAAPPAGVVQIQLLGGGRAAARTAYNQDFIALLKSLPEAGGQQQWRPDERFWEFPAAAAAALAAAVADRLGLEVQRPPKFVMKLFAEHTEGDEEEVRERLGNIPQDIWQRLFPFQREGVRRGFAHGGRCLLGDDMGLGKTVQARSLRFPVLT